MALTEVGVSAFDSAGISLRSPRNLTSLYIPRNMYGVKTSQQYFMYSEPWIQRTPYTTNFWIQITFAMGITLTNSSEIVSFTTNLWIQRTICQGTKGFVVSMVHCILKTRSLMRCVPDHTCACGRERSALF